MNKNTSGNVKPSEINKVSVSATSVNGPSLIIVESHNTSYQNRESTIIKKDVFTPLYPRIKI